MNPQQKGPEPGRGWCEPTAQSRQVAGLAATVPASRRVINPQCREKSPLPSCPSGGQVSSGGPLGQLLGWPPGREVGTVELPTRQA